MAIHAYQKFYLNDAQQNLAVMFDYALRILKFDGDQFFLYFIQSEVADKFGHANPKYIAGAMLALLEDSDEYFDTLTNEDWQEIGRLVNFEAEDLPVEILQQLMAVLVSKGAYFSQTSDRQLLADHRK